MKPNSLSFTQGLSGLGCKKSALLKSLLINFCKFGFTVKQQTCKDHSKISLDSRSSGLTKGVRDWPDWSLRLITVRGQWEASRVRPGRQGLRHKHSSGEVSHRELMDTRSTLELADRDLDRPHTANIHNQSFSSYRNTVWRLLACKLHL